MRHFFLSKRCRAAHNMNINAFYATSCACASISQGEAVAPGHESTYKAGIPRHQWRIIPLVHFEVYARKVGESENEQQRERVTESGRRATGFTRLNSEGVHMYLGAKVDSCPTQSQQDTSTYHRN